MTMRALSGTMGLGRPVKSGSGSSWPPWNELMLSVDWRAPLGITGMSVRLEANRG